MCIYILSMVVPPSPSPHPYPCPPCGIGWVRPGNQFEYPLPTCGVSGALAKGMCIHMHAYACICMHMKAEPFAFA